MKRSILVLALAVALFPALSAAQSGVDDRLVVSANGSSLSPSSAGDGGGGGSLGWLHNFNADSIVGVAGEYQTIADSSWAFGSVNFALGRGQAARRSNYYAEAHVGSGEDDLHTYDYAVYAAGLIQNITRQFAVQIEDKQIDIDTTHGNLPKVGVQMLWAPSLLTSASYAQSVSGNLGTKLGQIRVDHYGKSFNFLLGAAGGKASPALVDLRTGVTTPGLTLKQAFVGFSKPFARTDLTIVGDYLNLADTERVTLSVNCVFHLRGRGGAR
jgi:hypothetical protein